ncbi:acyl dehydratase [Crossiella equi]|uniref:Acyl dehydratase n=1 Tax=Crossiella equi TaxID=130796 RepID=A0ABS5AHR8_9PSEU|nr:MaoC/PaaZ C-terminal domain-containing protein [Crossiella equi]MBP2475917.1 acyl dehydratase [Crossiella equi]
MPIDLSAVGRTIGPWERSWTANEALLYALGVGAGADDPLAELAYTTENTDGVTQQVLPTFGVVLANFSGPAESIGEFDPAQLVHAEQELVLHQPLPTEGRISLRRTITDVFDKGKGALVVNKIEGSSINGEPLLSTTSSVFIRGEGDFGGERGPSTEWAPPEREPDVVLAFQTTVSQALLYRLGGHDHNPLHTDPAFAARGGFDRPILHGMCTYGITARLLIGHFCAGDATRMRRIYGRFTAPVVPGQELVVSAWAEGNEVAYRTETKEGGIALDRGAFTFA